MSLGARVAWALSGTFQYGFHTAALNSLRDGITCPIDAPPQSPCIPLSTAQYGFVTSAYTFGGLISSSLANVLLKHTGTKLTSNISATLILLGCILTVAAQSFFPLFLGRMLIGASCGIATVNVPLYLSRIVPKDKREQLGVLTQLSTVFGIFAAQALALLYSEPLSGQWRFEFAWPVALASATLIFGLSTKNVEEEPFGIIGASDSTQSFEDSADGLLGDSDADGVLSVAQTLASKDSSVRHGLTTAVLSHLYQQISGINGVMYYSTSILSAVLPGSAQLVSLAVATVNIVMTFPAIWLIKHRGSKTLFLYTSLMPMGFICFALAVGLNGNFVFLTATSILLYIAFFSVGAGPVPFVLVGERPPARAKAATGSISLAVNWSANLLVGLVFLPLQSVLGSPGNIFFLFGVFCLLGTLHLRTVID